MPDHIHILIGMKPTCCQSDLVREIKKSLGISMPFPDDSKSIMDAVLYAVLLNPKKAQQFKGLADESDRGTLTCDSPNQTAPSANLCRPVTQPRFV